MHAVVSIPVIIAVIIMGDSIVLIPTVGFECDELESLENGAVSKSSNSVGSVASYSCEPGFIISGPRERVCQLSAAWTNPSPSCECEEITYTSPLNLFIVHACIHVCTCTDRL